MSAKEFYGSLGTPRRIGLVVGLALLALATAAAIWWALTPRYQLLFGNLREADAGEIVESLSEWKVPYEYTEDGTGLRVPEDQVYDTRMKLVSEGVPSRGHVGFELFNESDFGATEFAQRINYQRALQGEIERTISALPGVESVRVHLTIRRPGLFLGEKETSKASVALALVPGVTLDPVQVGGIRNLVASAVDGLSPDAVVVLGPSGALLAGAGGDDTGAGMGERQGAYEQRVRERIQDLLSGVFGLDRFTVTVDARLNFDQVTEVSESLLPHAANGHGLLVRKQTTRPLAGADGATSGLAQEQVEYAHGSRREEVARAPGRVERLSIAVLVPPGLGKSELDRLQKLISAAAGLDPKRGDTLEIAALTADAGLDVGGDPLPALHEPLPPQTSERAGPKVASPVASMPGGWLMAGGAGLFVLGLLVGWWLHPRPPRLSPQEMDAMSGRLRTWLAEGGTSA